MHVCQIPPDSNNGENCVQLTMVNMQHNQHAVGDGQHGNARNIQPTCQYFKLSLMCSCLYVCVAQLVNLHVLVLKFGLSFNFN
jgi:hypothetical protein